MLHAIRWNLDRDQTDVRLFEAGKTYTARRGELPDERRVLTLGSSGYRRPATVHDSSELRNLFGLKGEPRDLFDLKGELEALLGLFTIRGLRFDAAACPYLQPGFSGQFLSRDPISGGEKQLVLFGRLDSELVREYKLRQDAWLAEVDFECLLGYPMRLVSFQAFSKFPAVERDFSLIVPDAVTCQQIEQAIAGLDMPEVRNLRPVDRFSGRAVPSGQYSLLLRVTFQSANHTLTSEEVAEAGDRLLRALEPLSVKLRQ